MATAYARHGPEVGRRDRSPPWRCRRGATIRGVRIRDLPFSNIAHELVGADHDVDACVIFVDAPPGRGPSLHKHPYAEILIVQDGEGSFIVGDREHHAGAGEVLIVPADTPHAFTNTGDTNLRQIDIHLSRSFRTEWL
jgi:mannose-6-phosphate isomerase-like protein (cupin superfamily)